MTVKEDMQQIITLCESLSDKLNELHENDVHHEHTASIIEKSLGVIADLEEQACIELNKIEERQLKELKRVA